MTDIARVRTRWENFPGAPGVTTMYMDPAGMQTKVDALRAFWEVVKVDIPTTTQLTVEPAGDVINDANGAITGSWSVTTPPAATICSGAGGYSGLSGLVIHWLTGQVRDGKRVRGRTFIVPIIGGDYETNGTLTSVVLTRVNGAAAGLVTALGGALMVWHRPVDDAVPPAVNHDGSAVPVTSGTCPDKAIVLRSRKT